MATWLISTINNGDTIAFDPLFDQLQIDDSGIPAASIQLSVSGSNLVVIAGAKTFTLSNTSLAQLTTSNVTFIDGSQLLVGDNATGTSNDDNYQYWYGTANSDQILGLGGSDNLYGYAGNDVLVAGTGYSDYLYGGEGNDTLLSGGGGYYYSGDNGDDSIVGGAGTGTEYFYGGNGNDTILGGDGNGYFYGNANNDSLIGGSGADFLDGGTGADTMVGGSGNDTYIVDDAGDIFSEGDGGGGVDKVRTNQSYTLTSDIENLELNANGLTGTGNASDNYISVYSGYNDTLLGADGNDTLVGGSGNDSLDGGSGNDSLDGGYGSDTLVAGDGSDTLYGGYYGNDSLDGGTGNDSLDGGYDNDTLIGGTGNDTLIGGGGNDSLVGGDGDDLYDVDLAGDTVVENAAEGSDTVRSLASYTLTANLENLLLQGSSAINGVGNTDANNIVGNSAANALSGSDGDDTLTGGDGNDTLDGGAGADSMVGGAGDDIYVVDDAGDVFSEGAGGGGIDTLRINRSATLDADFENIELTESGDIDGTGNALDNRLTGNSGSNRLDGGAGNDILDGGVGADTLIGGAGDDTYVVDDAGDEFEDGDTGGIDTVRINRDFNANATFENVELTGSADLISSGDGGDNRLYGNAGNNTLVGNAGNDVLAGAAGNDSLDGGLGNDVLDGGLGVDTMTGGAGDDTYVIDDAGDVFSEGAGGAGTDTVRINRSYTLGAEFENIELSGNSNIDATGSAGANRLTGNFGSNSLSGGAGIDTLDGGVGNDTLDGGAGADSMVGGAGNDVYVVDDVADVFVEGVGGAGTDTVRISRTYTLAAEFENLELTGTSAINGTGNTSSNLMVGNSAGNLMIGGSGADTIDGGSGADTIYGGFADTVSGTDYSSDSLSGGAGNDSLDGSYGYDTLDGGTGNDTMAGGGYDDIYYVDSSNDVVVELSGGGTDTVHSTAATYTLSGEVEKLYLDGSANINGTGNTLNNYLYGNTGNNSLAGLAGNDYLYGRAGNDTLDGGTGNDYMYGEEGDDAYYVDSASDYVYDSSGTDTVRTTLNSYSLSNGIENLVFTGSGAFTGTGDSYNNSIVGGAGNDSLTGNYGNDTLDGGTGADTLTGGYGDDTYIDDGTDVITESTGQGTDTLITTRTAVDMSTGTFQYFENAVFTGSGAFTATGNASANLLQGGAGNDSLTGGTGNDTLDGGLGNNTLSGGAGDDSYLVKALTDIAAGAETVSGGTDTISTSVSSVDLSTAGVLQYIENAVFTGAGNFTATGNASANSLAGASGNDSLAGGAGNDTLDGGAGNDSMAGGANNDSMAGGANDDTYYVDSDGDVVTENLSEGNDTVRSSVSRTLGDNQENLVLTGAANINGTGNELNNNLSGNTGNNLLSGAAGNDTLYGNTGNDSLDGGTGNDNMYGEAGDDTYYVDSASDYVYDSSGTDTVRTTLNSYTLSNYVENLVFTGSGAFTGGGDGYNNSIVGGAGNDSLSGNSGNDTLDGGVGVDSLIGGYGDDTYIDDGTDVITESTGQGIDTLITTRTAVDMGTGTFQYFEHAVFAGSGDFTATGNTSANLLQGSAGNDSLTGDAGNDTLDGGAGNDTLTGGTGNDIYLVGAGDAVVEAASEGTDTVQSSITWALAANTENLTLTGATNISGTGNADANQLTGNMGDNLLTGGDGNDTLVGGAGNDTLDGGAGNDSMAGGTSDDVYVIDSASDTVSENYNEGYDIVRTSLASGNLNSYSYIEGLAYSGSDDFIGTGNSSNNVLIGGAGNDSLAGNSGDDYLDAGAGQNTLAGGDGVDVLLGGSGSDSLDGGYGADYMAGGLGDDLYYADNISDVVLERAGEGYDTVYLGVSGNFNLGDGIETVIRTAYSYGNSLTGNAAANRLVGSSSGSETLVGGAGNDTLESGGGGYDRLEGGTGDDTFVVGSSSDVVVENASEGTDTVRALATYTLAANVENLILDGVANIGGTGNTLNNSIDGNDGNNTLDGGAGNDTLTGGLGNDTYILDSAGDVIVENDGEGIDTVQTSSSVTLSGSIENVILTGSGAINVTGTAADNALTGNSAANLLAGAAGNDTLDGGAGNDTLQGGIGDDTYVVDSTADTLTENAGEGTDTVRASVTRTLGANFENLILTGGSAINGTGNSLDNAITGNTADNTLDGGAGNDTLTGGTGNDTYIVDSADDAIVEEAGQGTDGVQSTVSYTLGANLETLTLLGSAGIGGTGNSADNLLTGNTGNNLLSGGDGNDTLQGGAGSDTLAGGAGNDLYLYDDALDTVDEGNNDGTDTLRASVSVAALAGNIENVELTGTGNLSVLGNAADNAIVGNTGGNLLQGGDGNDSLVGGAGNDTLIGGSGNDTLEGGAGTNRAVFSGNLADYDLYSFNGQLIVHARSGTDGTDTLTDIEFLQFNDATISGKSLLEFRVNTLTSGDQYTPSVVAVPHGFVVYWNVDDAFQRYDNTGQPLGGESSNLSQDATCGHPDFASRPNGGIVVVSGYDDVYLRFFNAEGAPVGTPLWLDQTPTSGATFDHYARVDALDDGGYVVIWEQWQETGGYTNANSAQVMGRLVGEAGEYLSAPFQISQTTLNPGVGSNNVTRVSTNASGAQANGHSNFSTISGDGRYVVFESDASNLVAGDTNAIGDVFLKDVQTGAITRVSTSSLGEQGNGYSGGYIGVSADGRYVAFESYASNLVAGDTNGVNDIFVKDMQTGTLTCASTTAGGVLANGANQQSNISANGRYVVIESEASNLVAGDTNASGDIFRKDLQTGDIVRVSTSAGGDQANGWSEDTSISSNGRYVVFTSSATNLVANDTNLVADVFLKDMQTGAISLVSTSSGGALANARSEFANAVSDDGRYVLFDSEASNLVSGDTNYELDLFLKDMQTGEIVRVSSDSYGNQLYGASGWGSMSADGRYVLFLSEASIGADYNNLPDAFILDTQTEAVVRVSTDAQAYAYSGGIQLTGASISADGRYATFSSTSTSLTAGDINYASDVFRVENPFLSTTPKNSYSATTPGDVLDVTAVAGGGFFSAWIKQPESGLGNASIVGRFMNADGTAMGSEFVIDPWLSSYGSQGIESAAFRTGVLVTWTDYDSTSGNGVVFGRKFDNDGNAVGGEFRVDNLQPLAYGVGDGRATTEFGEQNDIGHSAVVQSDGKILVAGSSGSDFALVRYNADGSLDISFDGDGKLTTSIGSGEDIGRSVTVLADGKILVAGSSVNGGYEDYALVRYNADGSLDTSFSGDGKLTTAIGSSADIGYSLTVQADGKILIAGESSNGSDGDFSLVRYNADGSLDTGFDGDGKLTTAIGSGDDYGQSITVQADGKILVAGYSLNGSDYDFALVRYNADGSLDTGFDGDGKVVTTLGAAEDRGSCVTVQADGKILVAGYVHNAGNLFDFALVRYNADGSLDTSFDSDGKVITDFSYLDDMARSVTVQADGKIIVAGESDGDFALARYNADGSLDASFDGDGKLITYSSYPAYAGSVVVQADGKIVVSGGVWDYNGNGDFAVARYNADGSLDTTFDRPIVYEGVQQGDVQAATLTDGGCIVVWMREDSSVSVGSSTQAYSEVWGRRYDAGGNVVGDEFIIDSNHSYATSPGYLDSQLDVMGLDSGGYVVVWTNGGGVDGSGLGIFAQIFDSGNHKLGYQLTGDEGDNLIIWQDRPGAVGPEAVLIDGGLGNDTISGWVGDDKVGGGDGNDSLAGGGGSDLLTGGDGNDFFDGGVGDNRLQGDTGTDTALLPGSITDYMINILTPGADGRIFFDLGFGLQPGDIVNIVTDSGRIDRLAGVEKVTFLGDPNNPNDDYTINIDSPAELAAISTINYGDSYIADINGLDVLYGSIDNDVMDGFLGHDRMFGYGGNDVMLGGDGADTLEGGLGNDALNGGDGDDSLLGGQGNDNYIVDSASDVVVELAGEGAADRVQTALTSFSIAAFDEVEVLEYTNTGLDFNGTGNAGNNLLLGNVGNDTLDGAAGNDSIQGRGGNDSLIGGAGNDDLDGGTGDDTMAGGAGHDIYRVDSLLDVVVENADEGNDTVVVGLGYSLGAGVENLLLTGASSIHGTGNELDNQMLGNAAANALSGGLGNDTLDGGAAADTLIGGQGNDTFIVDNAGDVVTEVSGEGVDTLQTSFTTTLAANLENLVLSGTAAINGTGNAADNRLTGNSAANSLNGGTGNDTLEGGTGADTLVGGIGNDTYILDSSSDAVTENANEGTADSVQAGFNYTLAANIENLALSGTGNINGTGNALNNQIAGNSGNNVLDGGAGNDTLAGGAGNDTYVVDSGADVVTESADEGVDLVQAAASFVLGENLEDLTLTGASAINGTGNALANHITGNAAANVLDGGAGDDSLAGGAGNDTYVVDSLLDIITESGADAGDTVQSGVAWSLGANLENLLLTGSGNIDGTGNALANQITGNVGDNVLDGGAGNDTMSGGAGNDTYKVDSSTDAIVEGAGAGDDNVQSTASYTLGANIENLTLLGAALSGTGNALANEIGGNANNNTLDGGAGNDTLAGGAGNDTYVVDATDDVIVEAAGEGTDLVQASASYTLSADIENLTLTGTGNINGTGNALNNLLAGNAGNNLLDGGVGADMMTGGAGNDTYVIDNIGDQVVEASGGGIDTLMVGTDIAIGNYIENIVITDGGNHTVTGSTDANSITGNAGNDTLLGLAGNDTLDGGAGNDSLLGGIGDDTYVVDSSADRVVENTSEGTDTIRSSIGFSLATDGTNVENLVLVGSSNIDGTGNALANQITGNGGDNVLDGGTGSDTLIGGAGNDTYKVDSSTDKITEDVAAGTDDVLSSVTYTLSANVENLTLSGTDTLSGTGNAGDNLISGNSSNNTLDGGAGNDTLAGGAGNDTYVVDATDDVVNENASEGTDLVQASASYVLSAEIENLTLTGTGNINGTGNALNNQLAGNAGNNLLDGGIGADTMTGGAGHDTYVIDNIGDQVVEASGGGIDTLMVGTDITIGNNIENIVITDGGNHTVTGSTDANSITGNAGNDTLNGLAGNDTLDGGAGDDSLVGDSGNDTYVVDSLLDVITETGADTSDTVQSSITWGLGTNLENLVLTGSANIDGAGNALANRITGNGGDNVLDGSTGNDTLIGGAGNDTYQVDSSTDVITEGVGAGTDNALSSATTYTLSANVENLTLTGAGNISGTGNAGDNLITGNSGNNALDGGAGNDTLDGGSGNDSMTGGAGNDVYYFDSESDRTNELAGGGIDTVYTSADIDLTVNANIENVFLLGTATLRVTGSSAANSLTGSNQADTLDGGAGDDTMIGGGGNDTMIGGAGNDTYVVDDSGDVVNETTTGAGGSDTILASVDFVLGSNLENLVLTGSGGTTGTGNGADNQLTGNLGSNTLVGGAGNDLLNGGVGADSLVGGSGNDIYVVDDIGDAVTEDAPGDGTDSVQAGVSFTLGANLENLTLTGSADTQGTGNAQGNQITGNIGNNVLDGGLGNDTLSGGAGNDTYIVDSSGDAISESAGDGVDSVVAAVSWTLGQNFENLQLTGAGDTNATGNALGNQLSGNSGNNLLNGGLGNDTLSGGLGNDTYVVDNANDVIIELGGEGTDTVQTGASYTLSANLENLVLTGTGNIDAIGNADANQLAGNAGSNLLDGGVGADTMAGGVGNDIYVVDNANDVLSENGAEGTDLVRAAVDWALGANFENLVLTGGDPVSGQGNGLNNQMSGNAANNILDGGTGSDTLAGGAGDDSYYVDVAGDSVVENNDQGTDSVFASLSYGLSAGVENLTLLGSGNFNAAGNGLENQLAGNTGNNLLDGGAGNDTLTGGQGDDIYIVDSAGDAVVESADEGSDTIRAALSWALGVSFENLELSGVANIDATGNAVANRIAGNTGNNFIDGGLGADTLTGGAGNDTYVVDNAGDQITEGATEGTADSVQSSISLTLAANIENLVLTGSANLDGAGNAANNQLLGNSGNNQLDGGAGGDTLSGGAGNDTYLVDSATDVVIEQFNEGIDTVRSQVNWTLASHLENLVLLGAALTGTGNAEANELLGNALGNTLSGLSGNDTLDGGAGNDTLVGGAGNDLFKVDSTTDVVIELSGDGSDIVEATASFTLAANIEVLKLFGSAVSGVGNELSNRIEGNSQDNVLDGGTGADTLVGGIGNDIYYVDNAGDQLIEAGGEGSDTVRSSVAWTLGATFENLELIGSGNINGLGNALNNIIVGNLGNNLLNGAAGADTLRGGAGNDTYEVDDLGDVVIENAAEGIDTVRSQVDFVLGANMENLQLLGVALLGTGNELANALAGNGLANTLSGGAGNDVLDGGAGADTLIGGAGDDTYYLDNLGDRIIEGADGGTDTLLITYNSPTPIIYTAPENIEIIMLAPGANNISLAVGGATVVVPTAGIDSIVFTGGGSITLGAGIENLALSQATGNIGGTGGAENNLLEGNSGANLLDGGAGNDTLKGYAGEDILLGGSGNDLLNGGKGADRLEGGLGDDTYVIDNSGDRIIEASGAGTDTVRSSLRSTTLGDNLENLVLEGTAKADGTGNALANQLTGNAKANCLTGGAGADTFIFNTTLGPLNVDTLTDFTGGQDRIALDDAIFTTLAGPNSNWYHSVTSLAQTDADDHILYDQGTGALYYDADGAGGAAAIRFAMLSGAPTLSATDLQVV